MHPSETTNEIVVRGIVIPIAWGRSGEPLRVAILTSDEGEFPVASRGLGRRLLRCIREEVRARVVLEPDPEGDELVRVLSFTIVGNDGWETPPPEPTTPGTRPARAAGAGGGDGT